MKKDKEIEVKDTHSLTEVERAFAFGVMVGMEVKDDDDRIDFLALNIKTKWIDFKKLFLKIK